MSSSTMIECVMTQLWFEIPFVIIIQIYLPKNTAFHDPKYKFECLRTSRHYSKQWFHDHDPKYVFQFRSRHACLKLCFLANAKLKIVFCQKFIKVIGRANCAQLQWFKEFKLMIYLSACLPICSGNKRFGPGLPSNPTHSICHIKHFICHNIQQWFSIIDNIGH